MTLPINRTALIAAQTNQIPNMVLQSALNIAAIQTPYDTIDELNLKVDANHAAGNTGSTQLADGSVITQKIAPLAVTSSRIANGAVGAIQLDPTLLTDYGNIAVQAEFDRRAVSLLKYIGLVSGSDWTAAIQALFNLGGNVYVPSGVYPHTGVTINNQLNITSPKGNVAILDNIGTGHGITVNSSYVTIDGLMIRGTSLSGSGIFLKKSGKFSNLILSGNGRYGVEFSSLVDIVSTHFNLCEISANKLGGVYCLSSSISQKNVVSFINCYVVGNGDISQVGATSTSGHGYYIEGGIDWSIIGGVSETNVGAGIYLKSNSTYAIYGFNVQGVHLETNRYANILVDATLGFMTDINITGNYYVSNISYSGSLIPSYTARSIVLGYSRLTFPNIDLTYSNNAIKVGFLVPKKSLKLGGEFETITPFIPYTSHIVAGDALADGYNVIRMDSTLGAVYNEHTDLSTFIDPRLNYRLIFEYRYKKTTSTSASLSVIQLNSAKANLGGPAFSTGLAAGDTWFIQEFLITPSAMNTSARYLQLGMTISGTVGASDYLLVRKALLFQIDGVVSLTGTTANRPTFVVIGYTFYDTTLGKPIWCKVSGSPGTWVDATGTTV